MLSYALRHADGQSTPNDTLEGGKMSRARWCLRIVWMASFVIGRPVHAGRPEIFDGAQQSSSAPSSVLIQYEFGGAGFLVSHDGAKEFGLVCSSSVSPELRGDTLRVYMTGGDAILVGGFAGLWRGDRNGCDFVAVDAMKDGFITAIAGDPDDPKRAYVTTANGGATALNGIFTNDGTNDTWTALGQLDAAWLQTLHVVKTNNGKRFWATKVFPDPPDPITMMSDNTAHYVVRYSDDDAETWTEHELSRVTQFGAEDPSASFRLIAVNPQNPDEIYGVVIRSSLPDDLLFSASRGEPGSWTKVAEVTDLGGIAFTPDGKLYFSDKDQTTRLVAVIDTPGSAPRTLADEYVIGCLRWDDSQQRMLACRLFQFGTLDLDTGAFSVLYDMRCGERFSTCPGIESACEAQLSRAWCFIDHYPASPLCAGYMIPGAKEFVDHYYEFVCVDGFAVPRSGAAAGTGGAAAGDSAVSAGAEPRSPGGSSEGPAPSGGATATATNITTAPKSAKRSSGCSIGDLGARGSGRGALSLGWAWFGLIAFACMKRRTRRLAAGALTHSAY